MLFNHNTIIIQLNYYNAPFDTHVFIYYTKLSLCTILLPAFNMITGISIHNENNYHRIKSYHRVKIIFTYIINIQFIVYKCKCCHVTSYFLGLGRGAYTQTAITNTVTSVPPNTPTVSPEDNNVFIFVTTN